MIVDISPESKVRYPNLVGSPSRSTLEVPPSEYCSKFLPPPSGTWPTFPSRDTLDVTLSADWPTIPQCSGFSCLFHIINCDNTLESKSEGLVGLGVFLCLTSHYCIYLGFQTVWKPLSHGTLSIFEIMIPFHLPILITIHHI